MGVIFWLSSRTADESSAQSDSILQWLINVFGSNIFTEFIVRKAAHCLEFAGLSLLFNIALCQTNKKKMPVWAVLLTSLYAVTDEIHQLFVPGRSCQFSDWVIDTCGAILGALVFLTVFTCFAWIKHKQKENKFIDSQDN